MKSFREDTQNGKGIGPKTKLWTTLTLNEKQEELSVDRKVKGRCQWQWSIRGHRKWGYISIRKEWSTMPWRRKV